MIIYKDFIENFDFL
jgi:hypothetical protein